MKERKLIMIGGVMSMYVVKFKISTVGDNILLLSNDIRLYLTWNTTIPCFKTRTQLSHEWGRGAITIASNACCLQGVFNPNMRFTAKPWLIENSFWNSTTNRRNMFLLFSLLATTIVEIQELREILQEIATILIYSWNISLYLALDWFHNQSWPWKTMRRTRKELLRGIIPCDVL